MKESHATDWRSAFHHLGLQESAALAESTADHQR